MSASSSRQPNVLLLAADNPSEVITHLRTNPALATTQDEHGYSLLHAAASYNHLGLLRALVNEFNVNVNLKDEDGETALFVAETLDCAKLLVEELHADITVVGDEGKSAREKFADDNDFPEVAVYLQMKELETQVNGTTPEAPTNGIPPPPPALPEGVRVNIGTMAEDEAGEVVDPEFRRRIEELAAREDFQGVAGQEALRELITEALHGEVGQERDVRQRTS